MKVVVQRSLAASVAISGQTVGEISKGLVVFVGFTHEDTSADINYVVQKMINLRIFEDEEGKMNQSLIDVTGELLSISQFTLFANTKKGRRPSFTAAAAPDIALTLYKEFNEAIRAEGVVVATGEFGADMQVSLVNDGPITITIDSKNP
ncbi:MULTISPECIES: D-aminoacyl-tRNA deacylase [Brochothrix]|uniref:D-aminoacyl-tRNA deacylase n=1 Tax=Brochothrix thermosphacta TaxID=2756 RepID=A0A1D2KIP3_BROTH|nr:MULTISPECIES: D-aminoacyl-tRNA deacylase [Brochothrix]SLM96911.1 D-tyrosyl-tRNA(Tyr) deacylase [Brachybacterium faecium]ANZ95830.1 D-tyrosyl-tRNA(Tyr) deacylase [Brochothrix thermosphacta]ANZ98035.1 D-tyrosyl-tRNA(Tyr) deacylase [Brochothrix thermosphacta]ATF25257.1 D-tyrosyl-tRNA(Tyr) deacylase [Brochothrix thermosphacta]ATH84640.1 D-tyrosyl-tRNA(Tyr) deacylase [Brochothrix thermosphacta]